MSKTSLLSLLYFYININIHIIPLYKQKAYNTNEIKLISLFILKGDESKEAREDDGGTKDDDARSVHLVELEVVRGVSVPYLEEE